MKIEFGDFQCPLLCRARTRSDPSGAEIFAERSASPSGNFRLLPHPHAEESSRAAEAAGLQGRFWEMHDLLYGSQVVWARAGDVRETFNQFAKSLDLDLEPFKADMESEQVKGRIIADQQRASGLSVNRTPAIFIKGQRLSDSSLNQKALQDAIDKAVNRPQPVGQGIADKR